MRSLLLLIALVCPALQGIAASAVVPTRMEFSVGQEQWRLPAQERMGMTSITLSHQLSPRLNMGLRAYTATGGQRGGFITLGANLQGRQQVWGPLDLEAEGFVGGGAGASGLALAGGGLMLRGALGLGYGLPNGLRLSAGWSRVRFPSGTIASTQPYVGVSIPFDVLTRGALRLGPEPSDSDDAGGDVRHLTHQLLPVVKRVRVNKGSTTTAGGAQADMGLVGVEWRTHFRPNWFAALQTEAAYNGSSAGYMDIMGGVGLRALVLPSLALYTDVMVGGGGGGAVNTGSGKLINTRLGAQLALGYGWVADASVSRLRATDGQFAARTVGIGLGYQFGGAPRGPASGLQRHDLRLRLASQRYSGSGQWRTSQGGNVGLVGAQLDYFVSPSWYLTGQGLAAATGGAGAYMTGQIGAGARMDLGGKTFVEAEALVGAAGGGGLNTGSGALGQANMNLGYQLRPGLELLLSAGRAQSSGSSFKANVVGLSLAYRLGVVGSR